MTSRPSARCAAIGNGPRGSITVSRAASRGRCWISGGSQRLQVGEHAARSSRARHARARSGRRARRTSTGRSPRRAASPPRARMRRAVAPVLEEAGPVVGRALARHACSQRDAASWRACTSDSGSALALRQSRRISRRLARCRSRQRLLLGARDLVRERRVGAQAVHQRRHLGQRRGARPGCRAAACWRPGPTRRSLAGAGSDAAACRWCRAGRRRASSLSCVPHDPEPHCDRALSGSPWRTSTSTLPRPSPASGRGGSAAPTRTTWR